MNTSPIAAILAVLFGVVAYAAGGAEPGKAAPLPTTLEIGDKKYAVVEVDSVPGAHRDGLPESLRFGEGKAIEGLPEDVRYYLEGAAFLRTPDGRFAVPFTGEAPFVGCIDLKAKTFVSFKDAFPPTGERAGGSDLTPTRYQWNALLDDGDKPAGMWLFVRRWDRGAKKFGSWRARVEFDAPDRVEAVAMDGVVPLRILGRREGEFLCEVPGDRATWARVSTETWKALATGKPADDYGHIGPSAYSPDGTEIYAAYTIGRAGLVVFDARTGGENAKVDVAGNFNAHTLGATFDPGGSTAAFSSPYQSEVALIDLKTRKVRARYSSAHPLAGVVFDADAGKAYALKTLLPYE